MNSVISAEIKDKGIEQYLTDQQHKSLLRLLTCGSVDDGKSTLIGRLLHDSHQIYEDQLATLHSDSQKSGTTGNEVDLALLVDGLAAEREQGITIDVAYRYFSTEKRKFIIADTPGHEQYTRNMATGASTCNLAVILIDARYGVLTQTKRHSFIASLLGIKHFVVAVNKMDLVDFSQARYEEIKESYLEFAQGLENGADDRLIDFVPLSALNGDNVVNESISTPWYSGAPLLTILENAPIKAANREQPFRLPVQYVNRPNLDFRGFSGTIAAGTVKVGDSVTSLPSGKTSTVKSLVTFDGDLQSAFADQAITLTLNDEIDVSRGDLLAVSSSPAQLSNRFKANIVWMSEQALKPGQQYDIKVATKKTTGSIEAIDFKVDVNTLEKSSADSLLLNEIASCEVLLTEKVVFDLYEEVMATGSFIIINRITNVTIGAGMISEALTEAQVKHEYSEFELAFNQLVRQHFPHWQALDLNQLAKK
ncbi:sulfate adenylyltransferase subunit CysN [Psychromonas aquimarina]|uniref:sulfate adenylyltransferase subunit CysN n=1 Tax=Psychromonas aquimarina TaxID=444919 RepID=UPI00048E785C|nr:sulfate adenylyltransferase subunit CysN [Psychromonas aquimarina]